MLALVAGLLFQSSASADVTAYCKGKYVDPAGLVDAAYGKYGTLYSGGLHHHKTDHVGATLDLYRLWRGLPDAKLRDANVQGIRQEYGEGADHWARPDVNEVWDRAKWAVNKASPGERDNRAYAFAAQGFDRLTGITQDLDSWRRGEWPEHSHDGWPQSVALMAKEPALDWMQSVAVASSADYALFWHLEPNMSAKDRAAHRSIAASDWKRFQSGEGIEWAVSAALHIGADDELEGLGETVAGWRKRVETCDASPAEYAALASTQAVLGRLDAFVSPRLGGKAQINLMSQMPTLIQSIVSRNALIRKLLRLPVYCARDGDEPLAATAPVEVVMQKLYAACEIEHVPLSDTAYAFRAYNLLSADNLAKLGKREGAPGGLVRAAFARHVALGNWQSAEDLLPNLMAASPEHADRIDTEWRAKRRPRKVRLARIILTTPNLSTMVANTKASEPGLRLHVYNALGGIEENGSVRGTRNLLREYAYGDIMQRDYEVMLRLPKRWWSLFGVRWGLPGSMSRAARRFRGSSRYTRSEGLYLYPSNRKIGKPGDRNGVPFIRKLSAVKELRALEGDAALMVTVSDIILDWSEARTDSWWGRTFNKLEADAEALAQLIELCRYNNCGKHAGKLQALRAFQMLKHRMAKTSAAKATKYWWDQSHRG